MMVDNRYGSHTSQGADDLVSLIAANRRRRRLALGLFLASTAAFTLVPRNGRAIWDIENQLDPNALIATTEAEEEPVTVGQLVGVDPALRSGSTVERLRGRGGPWDGAGRGNRDPNRARLAPRRDGGGTRIINPTTADGNPIAAVLGPAATATPGTTEVASAVPGATTPPATAAATAPVPTDAPFGFSPINAIPPIAGLVTTPTTTEPTTPVPEPALWAMMIAGFGMVGAAMRRRTARTRTATR